MCEAEEVSPVLLTDALRLSAGGVEKWLVQAHGNLSRSLCFLRCPEQQWLKTQGNSEQVQILQLGLGAPTGTWEVTQRPVGSLDLLHHHQYHITRTYYC